MIIVLKARTKQVDIDKTIARIKAKGLDTHVVTGEGKTIIG